MIASCAYHDATLLGAPSEVDPVTAAQDGRGNDSGDGDATMSTGDSPGTGDDNAGDVQVDYCGDGRVSDVEACDVGIEVGQPGACPTDCPAADPCLPRMLEGSGCGAHCLAVDVECGDADGCCPAECSNALDDDCSASCGDGVVQEGAGETCEVDAPDAEVAGSDACPDACPDDGDACTVEVLTGSAENCNAACVVTTIDVLDDDDGCCPAGSDSTGDADCPVVCGNGVVEEGEDCDGGMGCDACQFTTEGLCIEAFEDGSASCNACMCSQCTATVNGCFASGNAQRDADCSEIVYCGLAAGCRGAQCYCGLDVEPDGTCIIGDGPCAALIQQVAGTVDSLAIYNMQFDTNTALGRAHEFTVCDQGSCFDECP